MYRDEASGYLQNRLYMDSLVNSIGRFHLFSEHDILEHSCELLDVSVKMCCRVWQRWG